MSTAATHTQSGLAPDTNEIRIVSHSNLFYWWPVWMLGYILSFLTLIDGHYMAIVPAGAKAERQRKVEGYDGARDVIVVPADQKLSMNKQGNIEDPRLHVADEKGYGVLFAIILLIVIVITNVPLRGLWSFMVLGVIFFMSIIFTIGRWWDPILTYLDRLQIYINFAGYLTISTALFIIWLVTMLFFDPQIYMTFTPGQLRVRQEIGGGETAYDTSGMVIEKQRNDLFRHWILGLGSGDLVVKTSGAHQHHFPLPNVLFVGRKVKQIEEMLREKPVVQG